jgi:glycosyltransferase involved in cell wall biosynthesis
LNINSKTKIRILYIHPSLAFGGAEVLRRDLIKNKESQKFEISILCLEKIGELGEEIKKLGVPVYCLNESSKPYNFKATIALFFFLWKNSFDIVQTSLFNANFHGRIAAFLARVPIIFSEEHSEHYQYNSLKFLPYIWADKILSLVTERIICCCGSLREDIIKLERIRPDKFITILSAVDLDGLKVQIPKQEVLSALGVAKGDFIIGNIGSMSPRKGHEFLIHAFSLVKKKIPNTKLILVGNENQSVKERLLNLAKKLDIYSSIRFLGRQENCADYYGVMDVFVLSSLCEGIPLVILEAIKMGVPVVSTNVGGISEIIVNNETGILVPPRNAEKLSESIIELLNDGEKRSKLADNAKKECLIRVKPKRYIEELENLYYNALN